jgi:AcrR family transcriptional regulator
MLQKHTSKHLNNVMKKKPTRQLILEKSWDLFSCNSFFSISMQEIANYLNIKKSLIYYYFKSKSTLYLNALDTYFQNLFKKFAEITQRNLSPLEKINKISQIYYDELQSSNISGILYTNDKKIDNSISQAVDRAHSNILNFFERIISEGINAGVFKNIDPRISSLAIMGYIEKNKQYNNKLETSWLDIYLLKKQ